jgi:hypothetical protein
MSRTRTAGKSLPQATRGMRSAGRQFAENCLVALHGHG